MFSNLKRKWQRLVFALAGRIGLDRAVAYAVMARLWQLIAGLVTVILITRFFTPELQGYYVTIISLLAIQSFVDFGLSGILLLLASHEWSSLSLKNGVTVGDEHARQRLAEICQFGDRSYRGFALLFFAIVVPAGIVVMSKGVWAGVVNQHWFAPFVVCAVVNSLSMLLTPKEALLEGCSQVVEVNRMRLRQSVTGSVSVWISIALGFGLWTLVVSNLVRTVWELRLVFAEYRPMLQSLSKQHTEKRLDWHSEVRPLQWRLALQSIGGYFATWFIVPVTFKFHGEVLAGQLGLTWQLLKTVQAASMAWVQTRLPKFGGIVAAKDYALLDHQFVRNGAISLSVFVLGIVGFLVALLGVDWIGLPIASRFLDVPTLLYFALGMFGVNLCMVFQTYVRLFKVDPFLVTNLVSNSLTGTVIYFVGRQFGPTGLALGMAATVWLYSLPVAWMILRRHRRRYLSAE